MKEVQLNNTVSFSAYVYQDFSVETSATRSPALNLDPEYTDIPFYQRYAAMIALERHISTSILAYRALAWWACRLDWQKQTRTDKALIALARSLHDVKKKPKEHLTMEAVMKGIQ